MALHYLGLLNFHHEPVLCWVLITAENDPLGPEAVLVSLQGGRGWDYEQALTPCCSESWEKRAEAWATWTGDTYSGLEGQQRLVGGTESEAAPQ